MFQAMVERIREEPVQQVPSYASSSERALAAAEEDAGGSITARPWLGAERPVRFCGGYRASKGSRKWSPPNLPLLRRRARLWRRPARHGQRGSREGLPHERACRGQSAFVAWRVAIARVVRSPLWRRRR